jgi:hypothetical protein
MRERKMDDLSGLRSTAAAGVECAHVGVASMRDRKNALFAREAERASANLAGSPWLLIIDAVHR